MTKSGLTERVQSEDLKPALAAQDSSLLARSRCSRRKYVMRCKDGCQMILIRGLVVERQAGWPGPAYDRDSTPTSTTRRPGKARSSITIRIHSFAAGPDTRPVARC